jgi:hypothetical protein
LQRAGGWLFSCHVTSIVWSSIASMNHQAPWAMVGRQMDSISGHLVDANEHSCGFCWVDAPWQEPWRSLPRRDARSIRPPTAAFASDDPMNIGVPSPMTIGIITTTTTKTLNNHDYRFVCRIKFPSHAQLCVSLARTKMSQHKHRTGSVL